MQSKINWMLEQLGDDEFETSEAEVRQILAGQDLEMVDAALVDYVLELEDEWTAE